MEINLENKEFQNALELIQISNQTFFLTGKAGTGKSTFLRHIIKTVSKKFVVVAPTGIAAVNVKGVTIHSFFSFPLRPLLPDDFEIKTFSIGSEKRSVIEAMDTLIIDEISMVRADIIDAIDCSLRRNGGNPNLPFGGKQVVFVGDVFQLEPVTSNKTGEYEIIKEIYVNPYFFNAKVLKKINFFTIELLKVYRQTDRDFIDLLDKVRIKEVYQTDLDKINTRLISENALINNEFTITLSTTNAIANQINTQKLLEINTQLYTYKAEISGVFEESKYPTDAELNFKVGAQVVFVKNDSEKRWFNGTIGKIEKLFEKKIIIKLEDGNTYVVELGVWDNIKFQYNRILNKIESEVIGTFQQYPLKLAWAITIHKSQGLTFDKIIIDFGRGAFASGQAYVALSRAKTIEGLFLKRRIFATDIIVHNELKEFAKSYNNESTIEESINDGKELSKNKNIVKEIFLKNPRLFVDLVCEFYSLNICDFKKYNNYFNLGNWEKLCWNKNIPWSLELIEKFKDEWIWSRLSTNDNIPCSIELLDKYEHKWDWLELSKNRNLPWSSELIEKFKNRWDWISLSENENLPWNIELIEKFENYWIFYRLSVNEKIPWSMELIVKYENFESEEDDKKHWCWYGFTQNRKLPWSIELIEKILLNMPRSFGGKFPDIYWENLSCNPNLPWSIEFIKKYEDKWDWISLSINVNMPWTIELIEKFKDKWFYLFLSSNEYLPWSLELIEKYEDKWWWEILSSNEKLPWSTELIEKYKNKWGCHSLSIIKKIDWSLEKLKKNEDKLHNSILSSNEKLPLSIELIEKFSEEWNCDSSIYECSNLSEYKNLPWSLAFINKFAEKWKPSEQIWEILKSFTDAGIIEEVFNEIEKENILN